MRVPGGNSPRKMAPSSLATRSSTRGFGVSFFGFAFALGFDRTHLPSMLRSRVWRERAGTTFASSILTIIRRIPLDRNERPLLESYRQSVYRYILLLQTYSTQQLRKQ